MTPEYKFCDDGKVILKNPEMLSQRTWVGLTDEDLEDIAVVAKKGNLQDLRIVIEAQLKAKNFA
jgi:hypothetical protein